MNILNKPEYSSIKIVLLVALVGVLGYFVFFSGGSRGLDQSGRVTKDAQAELLAEFNETGTMMPVDAEDFIEVEMVSTNIELEPAGDPGEGQVGTFSMVFNITAHGDDAYIDNSCRENASNVSGQGIEYSMLHKNKNTTSCVLTSTASLDGEGGDGSLEKFEIDEGDTEEFTLTVVATAQADHTTQVLLNSINWTTQPDEVADLFFNEGFGPLSEFKTNTIFLNFY